MKNKSLILILLVIFLLINLWLMYFISPTQAEVERYFEKNKCIYCSGDVYGEVYQMRRTTGMLFGQIFDIPIWWVLPNFMLYTTTPFNYYHDISDEDDEFSTFTWIDTRNGRFVYNAVTGEYVKEIDDKEHPLIKYNEDMEKKIEELKN